MKSRELNVLSLLDLYNLNKKLYRYLIKLR